MLLIEGVGATVQMSIRNYKNSMMETEWSQPVFVPAPPADILAAARGLLKQKMAALAVPENIFDETKVRRAALLGNAIAALSALEEP